MWTSSIQSQAIHPGSSFISKLHRTNNSKDQRGCSITQITLSEFWCVIYIYIYGEKKLQGQLAILGWLNINKFQSAQNRCALIWICSFFFSWGSVVDYCLTILQWSQSLPFFLIWGKHYLFPLPAWGFSIGCPIN